MEGAERLMHRPGPIHLHVLRDDIEDVQAVFDLLDGISHAGIIAK